MAINPDLARHPSICVCSLFGWPLIAEVCFVALETKAPPERPPGVWIAGLISPGDNHQVVKLSNEMATKRGNRRHFSTDTINQSRRQMEEGDA